MIILDCIQGTPEWHDARLSIPTGSGFGKIHTGTGKASTQAGDYMKAKLAEWAWGVPCEGRTTKAMEAGTLAEPQARAYYEFMHDVEVTEVGLVLRDDKMSGASPDGLLDNGGLEIKRRNRDKLIGYHQRGDIYATEKPQIQGNLWICEREWWDFVAFNELAKPFEKRIYRDEHYIASLAVAIDRFNAEMLEKREELKKKGIKPCQPN